MNRGTDDTDHNIHVVAFGYVKTHLQIISETPIIRRKEQLALSLPENSLQRNTYRMSIQALVLPLYSLSRG